MRNGTLVWILLMVPTMVLCQTRTIVYEKGTGTYEIAVLDRALARTVPEYGRYRLMGLEQGLTERRAEAMLNQGGFDVTFMVLTPERERTLLPIRVDLTRGAQGYRLLLTRRDLADRVASVQSVEDLKTQFTVGFGAQWTDLQILRDNGFRLVTATDPRLLYPMLQNRRFDIFPRGLNEVWGNLAAHQQAEPQLVVADHVALMYPLVECFIVAKTNTALAARLTLGLKRMLDDGTLKRMFDQTYGEDLRRAMISSRRVFVLTNTNLPKDGPVVDTSWWLPTR